MKNERLKLIEEMLETNPDDSFLNYAAALEFNKHGRPEKAVELLEKLYLSDPDYLPAYYQLGKLYESGNKMEKAILIYRQGIVIAKKQNDQKTFTELNEALVMLEEEE